MKLYRAEVEVAFYMVAESEDDAEWEAPDHAREALREGVDIVTLHEVKPGSPEAERIPKEWLTSLPYGGADGPTIEKLLAKLSEEKEPVRDTWTLDLFGKTGG